MLFFHYSLATSTYWVQTSWDTPRIRRLLFDNYQRCPVPFEQENCRDQRGDRLIKEEKHPCPPKLCALRCLEFETSAEVSNSKSNNCSEKLLLYRKLSYFRGSRFSQCLILSIALHCLLPKKFLCSQLFWVITNSVRCLQTIDRSTHWIFTILIIIAEVSFRRNASA